MKRVKVIVLSLCGMISACSSVASQTNYREPLYAVLLKKTGIQFEVRSTGCTKAKDFEVKVRAGNEVTMLEIERVKTDRCRKMPEVVSIFKRVDFSNIDTNLDIMFDNPFKIKNK